MRKNKRPSAATGAYKSKHAKKEERQDSLVEHIGVIAKHIGGMSEKVSGSSTVQAPLSAQVEALVETKVQQALDAGLKPQNEMLAKILSSVTSGNR